MGGDGGIGWIREVVLDCADPWALARFWAGLLGGTPLAEHTARVHSDILVDDLAAAHDRVLAAGAVLAEGHVSPRRGPAGEPIPWRVYRDPAGHPFCLVVR